MKLWGCCFCSFRISFTTSHNNFQVANLAFQPKRDTKIDFLSHTHCILMATVPWNKSFPLLMTNPLSEMLWLLYTRCFCFFITAEDCHLSPGYPLLRRKQWLMPVMFNERLCPSSVKRMILLSYFLLYPKKILTRRHLLIFFDSFYYCFLFSEQQQSK